MKAADVVLAIICFLCFAVGIPANGVSLNYFLRKTQNIPVTCIYIAVSALDIFTSNMVLPVGEFELYF